ncbi:growth arrest and DNA damage-inducible proteins-interacting protein CRIF [Anticarsia gemmatalis]|uniref:growth arrest and DNA damage-inducible proteins-interacting protein CRIF n=1 Tax=Anticarsia gemmatalis TaxID=129554 RepID=UPI003F771DA4
MNLCIRSKYMRPNLVGSLFRYSITATEVVETNEHVLIDDSDDAQAKEAEIEKKRDISRLSSAHRNLINGLRPYEEPKSVTHLTVKYNRKMYGKYGSASGVNPMLCFPTKRDIAEIQEYEAVAFPFSIKEMMEQAARMRKEEQGKIEQRDREVATKYAKLAQWKKDLEDKIAKKTAEANAAKEKKERLVEEVRRHFGFKLDPRDERFQEMLAKREKEQKKQEKLAKREAKEKEMIAKLQQKNVKLGDKST